MVTCDDLEMFWGQMLSETEADEFRAHLVVCGPCFQGLAEFMAIDDALERYTKKRKTRWRRLWRWARR